MLQAAIENRAAVTGLASVKTAETRSPKLLKVFGHSGLNIESESQMHLTRSHSQRQWIVSSVCSSQRL